MEKRTPMNIPVRALPRKHLLALYIVGSLVAILYLPYLFPANPTASDSYIFGYNNRIGIVLLLLLSATGAIWTNGLNIPFSSIGPSTKIPLRFLWTCLLIELASCAAMYLFAGRFGGFRESSYEIDRVWLLSQGKVPYVDFEWPFGPALLYGPLWLSHLLHLQVPQAYYIFWTIASVVGVALLFAAINLVDYPSNHKTSIFLLIFVTALTPVLNMGTHYTLLRYLCPLFFILVIHKRGQPGPQAGTHSHAAILAVVFTAILFMISPEMAVAHAFACMVLLFPGRPVLERRGLFSPYFGMLVALTVLLVCALKIHLFDTMLASGGGADSFPIPFAPTTLLFFAVVFVCACYLVRRAAHGNIRDNTIALIILSIPMTAAALGRCDPGHMLMNGMGYVIAVFFYASGSPRMWKLFCTGFIIFFVFVCSLPLDLQFLFALKSAEAQSVTEDALPGHSGSPTSTSGPQAINFASVYPERANSQSDGIYEAPFGYKPNTVGSYLSDRINYGYYEALENANTPEAIRRKVSELAQHPNRSVLLGKDSMALCRVDPHMERFLISYLFVFPYDAPAVHSESIRKPLCDYILSHYTLAQPATPEDLQYQLWVPEPIVTQ